MSAARPWRRAALWLAFLGPFFFASYGFANWMAGRRDTVGAIAFAWEHRIPFVPWTIVPYWSIDLLYAISVFVCATRRELDRHAQRLVFVQLVSVICFLAFPLRFSFDRPQADGLFGAMFAALGSFDKPFNQAPSLHISLLALIWVRLGAHLGRRGRWVLHVWMVLIGLSTLTTYQHHFIDLPTGLAVGFAALWLLPDEEASPLYGLTLTRDLRRQRLALVYGVGAVATALPALLGGFGLWFLWLATALALVALNYAAIGARGFQKGRDGRLSAGALGLFAPYVAGAWINSRLWTRRHPEPCAIADGVWIGRIPGRDERRAIVDLCAEIPCRARAAEYVPVPMLDLVVPERAALERAAAAIDLAQRCGPVLVCCALGYSRSAAAVAAWLLRTKRAKSAGEAMLMVRAARPAVVLHSEHGAALEALA